MTKNDKKHLDNYFTAWLIILSLLFCSIIFFIFIPHADALVLRPYEFTETLGSTIYYGWELPDRVGSETRQRLWYSLYSRGYDNGIFSSCQSTDGQCGGIMLSENVGIYEHNDLNSEFDNNSADNNNNVNDFGNSGKWVGTPVSSFTMNELGASLVTINKYKNNGFNIQFRPGEQGPLSEVLSDGFTIDYDSYYTYTFGIILQVDSGDPVLPCSFNFNGQPVSHCNGPIQANFSNDKLITVNSGGKTYKTLYRIYNVDTRYLNLSQFGNVTPESYWENHYFYGYNTNQGQLSSGMGYKYNPYSNNTTYVQDIRFGSTDFAANIKFTISRPYNIIVWKDSGENLFCQDKCWTQEDTVNYDETDEGLNNLNSKEQNLIEQLFNGSYFDDFGLQTIFMNIFNKIKDVFANFSNNSCYGYRFNMLGKDIILPCGKSFWTRSDMTSFIGIFWSVAWTFFIGLFIARSIYLKIVAIFDVDTGVVVDAKEISKL